MNAIEWNTLLHDMSNAGLKDIAEALASVDSSIADLRKDLAAEIERRNDTLADHEERIQVVEQGTDALSTRLAALEQRVGEHIEESMHADSKVLDRLHALEVWHHTQHPHPSATCPGYHATGEECMLCRDHPAPAEERGGVDREVMRDVKALREQLREADHEIITSRAELATERATANAAVNEALALRHERDKACSELEECSAQLREALAGHHAAEVEVLEWRGKALDVAKHPAVVALTAERDAALADAATARGELETVKGLLLKASERLTPIHYLIGKHPEAAFLAEVDRALNKRALSSSPPPATGEQHEMDAVEDCRNHETGSYDPAYPPPQPSPEKCPKCGGLDGQHTLRSCIAPVVDPPSPEKADRQCSSCVNFVDPPPHVCGECGEGADNRWSPKPSPEKGQGEKP